MPLCSAARTGFQLKRFGGLRGGAVGRSTGRGVSSWGDSRSRRKRIHSDTGANVAGGTSTRRGSVVPHTFFIDGAWPGGLRRAFFEARWQGGCPLAASV